MTLITYQRRAVAIAGSERFYLAPHVAARADGDALKRFVCFLVLYARDVQSGQLPDEPRRYAPCRAERYAREMLMPPIAFAAMVERRDDELAAHFGVPVEQVARRREDLAIGPRTRRPVPGWRRQRRRWCQPASDRHGSTRY